MIDEFTHIANRDQRRFLEAYAQRGVIRTACLTAGIMRATVNDWLDKDEIFQNAFAIAESHIDDAYEIELMDRALNGDKKPVIYKGEMIYERNPETGDVIFDDFGPRPLYIQEKSERLLMYALERRDRRKSKSPPTVNISVEFKDAPDWDNPTWDEETGYLKS